MDIAFREGETNRMPVPERIYCRERAPSSQRFDMFPKGRILLRMDPAAIGRGTRMDLAKQGYAVTSLTSLNAEAVADHSPDIVVYFHHTDEPVAHERLRHLPQDVPVLIAVIGASLPDPGLFELAKNRGYGIMASKHGPNLHQMLKTLHQLRGSQLN